MKNKNLLLTSLVCLVPAAAGLLLWGRLPERMPIHWNYSGQIDGWGGKGFVVLGLPLILLGVHLFCAAVTALDPKRGNISGKTMALLLWICPCVSVVLGAVVYGTALGMELRVDRVIPALVCVLLILIGNYLPKCRQNYTVGIKLPWTLEDEGNWNATHRFSGWLWVAGGLASLLGVLLGQAWVLLALLPVLLLATAAYSWNYHRTHS